MELIPMIIIFICLCTDNMVTANMSAMKMDLKTKSIFSIKAGLYFSGFNALMFTIGYILSIIFFRGYFVNASNWIAFAFLLLLGIKYMLETVEKSPSFKEEEANDTKKMLKVSLLSATQFLFIGYPLELQGKSWFPQVIFLLVITFLMTILGFHLGSKTSRTIRSKKVEFVAGLILAVMAIRMIIL
ncbi:MAG: manganese efflux pump [Elusimicrobiaceae bacterium]|nr:manganese efflux pump [Elusimicrobiaceae bacterium]